MRDKQLEPNFTIDLITLLSEGDLRTIGVSDQVVALVERSPELLEIVFSMMESGSPGTRMRCADVLEKVSGTSRHLLFPFQNQIFDFLSKTTEAQITWHFLQILPRLQLDDSSLESAKSLALRHYKSSISQIVRVNALEALVKIAALLTEPNTEIENILTQALIDPAASVRARARKLYQPFLKQEID